MHLLTLEDRRLLTERGWLSLCSPELRDGVLAKCRVQVLEPGASLFRHGDPATGLVAVLSGAFAVSIVVPEFGPTVSHVMRPGAWFGESAYFGQPRSIGVHATRMARAGLLAMSDINAMVHADPGLWTAFAQLAVLNGQLAIGAAYDLMLRDPRQRCAATLLRLSGLRHAPPLSGTPFELDITQADLAHMTNLSRNTVAVILKEFRAAHCVDWNYRHIRVLNSEWLQQILSADQ